MMNWHLRHLHQNVEFSIAKIKTGLYFMVHTQY